MAFNGLDVKEILRPSKTQQTAMMREIRAFIRENNIKEMKDFMDYADEESPRWGTSSTDTTTVSETILTAVGIVLSPNRTKTTKDYTSFVLSLKTTV